MQNKKMKVKIWKRVLSVVLALILMATGTVIGQEDNSITANAGGSPVIFKEGDTRILKVGKYQVIQETGSFLRGFKIKVQKGSKVLFSKKVSGAMLLGKKVYYGYSRKIYCYNIEKSKNTVVVDILKEIENGYTDYFVHTDYSDYAEAEVDGFFEYQAPYLYYQYIGIEGETVFHKVNLKTGKTKLLGNSIYKNSSFNYAYHTFYKEYVYLTRGDMGDSPGSDVHFNMPYICLSLNGKEKTIIKNCGDGNAVRYKNRLYYVQYKIRKSYTEIEKNPYKQTTYLKSCNLDGSNTKILKKWKNQTMELSGISGNAIYLQKQEAGVWYQYSIKNKKVKKAEKCAKVTNVKVKAVKGTNSCNVSWNGIIGAGALGFANYEISYAANPQFKGKKVLEYNGWSNGWSRFLPKNRNAVIKGLKKGQTYYVKVRTKMVGQKDKCIYSPYSKAKKVTIK